MSNDPNPNPKFQRISDRVADMEDWQVLEELADHRVELPSKLSEEIREVLYEVFLDQENLI